MPEASASTIARALRLLATQQKASRNYYERNKDRIRQRSADYWREHKDELNAARRERARQKREAGQEAVPAPASQVPAHQ